MSSLRRLFGNSLEKEAEHGFFLRVFPHVLKVRKGCEARGTFMMQSPSLFGHQQHTFLIGMLQSIFPTSIYPTPRHTMERGSCSLNGTFRGIMTMEWKTRKDSVRNFSTLKECRLSWWFENTAYCPMNRGRRTMFNERRKKVLVCRPPLRSCALKARRGINELPCRFRKGQEGRKTSRYSISSLSAEGGEARSTRLGRGGGGNLFQKVSPHLQSDSGRPVNERLPEAPMILPPRPR